MKKLNKDETDSEIRKRVDKMQSCEHLIAYLGFLGEVNDVGGSNVNKFFYALERAKFYSGET